MTPFPRVALPPSRPGGPHPSEITEAIEAWARSEALDALLRGFGLTPPQGTLSEVLPRLLELAKVWDYRKGAERSAIKSIDYDPALADLIDAATTALGLADVASPSLDDYDHVLILGGGPRTGLARSHFAAKLLGKLLACRSAPVRVGVLSSLRVVSQDEKDFAHSAGLPPITVEADAMEAAARLALSADKLVDERSGETELGAPWWVRTFEADGLVLDVLAAPTSEPPERADTGDGFVGWAELAVEPRPSDRVLAVTTDLFVPFQHAIAVRLLSLRYGCGVDTVGLDPAGYRQWMPANTHSKMLQEVLAAIDCLVLLHEASA